MNIYGLKEIERKEYLEVYKLLDNALDELSFEDGLSCVIGIDGDGGAGKTIANNRIRSYLKKREVPTARVEFNDNAINPDDNSAIINVLNKIVQDLYESSGSAFNRYVYGSGVFASIYRLSSPKTSSSQTGLGASFEDTLMNLGNALVKDFLKPYIGFIAYINPSKFVKGLNKDLSSANTKKSYEDLKNALSNNSKENCIEILFKVFLQCLEDYRKEENRCPAIIMDNTETLYDGSTHTVLASNIKYLNRLLALSRDALIVFSGRRKIDVEAIERLNRDCFIQSFHLGGFNEEVIGEFAKDNGLELSKLQCKEIYDRVAGNPMWVNAKITRLLEEIERRPLDQIFEDVLNETDEQMVERLLGEEGDELTSRSCTNILYAYIPRGRRYLYEEIASKCGFTFNDNGGSEYYVDYEADDDRSKSVFTLHSIVKETMRTLMIDKHKGDNKYTTFRDKVKEALKQAFLSNRNKELTYIYSYFLDNFVDSYEACNIFKDIDIEDESSFIILDSLLRENHSLPLYRYLQNSSHRIKISLSQKMDILIDSYGEMLDGLRIYRNNPHDLFYEIKKGLDGFDLTFEDNHLLYLEKTRKAMDLTYRYCAKKARNNEFRDFFEYLKFTNILGGMLLKEMDEELVNEEYNRIASSYRRFERFVNEEGKLRIAHDIILLACGVYDLLEVNVKEEYFKYTESVKELSGEASINHLLALKDYHRFLRTVDNEEAEKVLETIHKYINERDLLHSMAGSDIEKLKSIINAYTRYYLDNEKYKTMIENYLGFVFKAGTRHRYLHGLINSIMDGYYFMGDDLISFINFFNGYYNHIGKNINSFKDRNAGKAGDLALNEFMTLINDNFWYFEPVYRNVFLLKRKDKFNEMDALLREALNTHDIKIEKMASSWMKREPKALEERKDKFLLINKAITKDYKDIYDYWMSYYHLKKECDYSGVLDAYFNKANKDTRVYLYETAGQDYEWQNTKNMMSDHYMQRDLERAALPAIFNLHNGNDEEIIKKIDELYLRESKKAIDRNGYDSARKIYCLDMLELMYQAMKKINDDEKEDWPIKAALTKAITYQDYNEEDSYTSAVINNYLDNKDYCHLRTIDFSRTFKRYLKRLKELYPDLNERLLYENFIVLSLDRIKNKKLPHLVRRTYGALITLFALKGPYQDETVKILLNYLLVNYETSELHYLIRPFRGLCTELKMQRFAIESLKKVAQTRASANSDYYIYAHMGILAHEIKANDEALDYYKKSIECLKGESGVAKHKVKKLLDRYVEIADYFKDDESKHAYFEAELESLKGNANYHEILSTISNILY